MSINATAAPAPLYARFSRRLRGIVVDWIIAMTVIFGAVFVAATIANDNFSRALGIAVIVALLLYEPVLVSFTGGTLGHYSTNLRVVDDRSGGNVSSTRRNQAIHDLLTRSTVQIRDPASARPGQYITERVELATSGMPSGMRRVVTICVYLLLLVAVFIAVAGASASAGWLSRSCIEKDYCSGAERTLIFVISVALLVMIAAVIALGWKGNLFGARKAGA